MRRIDRYELRGELGRGGVGVVYRAFDPDSAREVAVKVLLATAQLDPELVERFRIEVRAGSALDHPGISRVRDAGVVDGKPFIVTELATGGSLADRLRRGPLPPSEAARLIEQVARALHHAHERDVVHRDLKPANVLLDAVGQPVLTDFGMARFGDARLTVSGDVLGTPAYMAPEQAEGARQRVGPWSDVYSLGATLYELLTGRPPFTGTSAWDVIKAVLTSEPPPPRALRPEVDAALEAICLRAMAKDPARRHGSARELAEALAGWRAGANRPAPRQAPRAALVVVGLAGLGLVAFLVTRGAPVRPAAQPPARPATQPMDRPAPDEPAAPAAPVASAEAPRAEGDLAAAVDDLTRALERPGAREVELRLARATLLVRLRRFKEAFLDADRTISGHSDNALAHALRACARGLEDSPAVSDDADRAIKLDPRLALAWRMRGMVSYHQGELARARVELERAVELARAGDPRLDRAQGLEAPDLETALRLSREPLGEEQALGRLAALCWRAGEREVAREHYRAALAGGAEDPTALEVMALDLLDSDDHEGALRAAERIDADRRSAERAYVIGTVLHGRGDPAGMAELWTAYLYSGWLEGTKNKAYVVVGPVVEGIMSHLFDGEDAAAMAQLEPILRARPRFGQGLVLRGKARLESGDARGALRDIEDGIALDGLGPIRRTFRGEARLGVGDAAGAFDDVDQALREAPPIGMAARVSPTDRRLIGLAWRVCGLARAELGDPRGALADLERATAFDGPTWTNLRARARVLRGLGDEEGARREFEAAERVASPVQRARSRLEGVMTLIDRGAFDEALAECDATIAAVPDLARAWRARAGVKLARGDAAGAVDDATRALELAPHDLSALSVRVEALFHLRRSGEAHADLRRLVREAATADNLEALERLETALSYRARQALEAGRREEALAECQRLVRDLPENRQAWVLLGRLCAEARDLESAAAAFERALELRPADLDVAARLAVDLSERGGARQASALLDRAATRTGSDALLLVNVGRRLVEEGQAALARGVLERAVRADVRTPELLVARADARQLVDDDRGAAEDLEEALRLAPGHPLARLARAHLRRWADGDPATADAEVAEALLAVAADQRAELEAVIDRDRAAAACPFDHPHSRR